MLRLDEFSAGVTRRELQSPVFRSWGVVAESLPGFKVLARVQPETPFYSHLHRRRRLRGLLEHHFTDDSCAPPRSFADIFRPELWERWPKSPRLRHTGLSTFVRLTPISLSSVRGYRANHS